jgi:CRP-like cAMP-binding protein
MVDSNDLRQLDFFNVFSGDHLREVGLISDKRHYKANQIIYTRGEKAGSLFLVCRGMVSLRDSKPGDPGSSLAFEICERGDLLGVAYFTEHQSYTLAAVCLEDTELIAIDAEKLHDLCEADPLLGYRLMKRIAQIYFIRYETAKRELGFPVANIPFGK